VGRGAMAQPQFWEKIGTPNHLCRTSPISPNCSVRGIEPLHRGEWRRLEPNRLRRSLLPSGVPHPPPTHRRTRLAPLGSRSQCWRSPSRFPQLVGASIPCPVAPPGLDRSLLLSLRPLAIMYRSVLLPPQNQRW
jgi:hypothetical protein